MDDARCAKQLNDSSEKSRGLYKGPQVDRTNVPDIFLGGSPISTAFIPFHVGVTVVVDGLVVAGSVDPSRRCFTPARGRWTSSTKKHE